MTRAAAAWGLAVLLATAATAQDGPQDPAVTDLLDRMQAAWGARDPEAWARLWRADRRAAAGEFARAQFEADESRLTLFRPRLAGSREPFQLRADVFDVREPRGRVAQWLFDVEPDAGGGWRLADGTPAGAIEGLLHLRLSPAGFRVRGASLRLEDFELFMRDGSLFTSPESMGRTVLVFVGRGEVRFRPRPQTEREQLAKFAGDEEMVERVDRAFVRLNPEDLASVLSSVDFDPDPATRRDLSDALDYYSEHVDRFFVLDARAPRAPWWLVPGRGDAVVTFQTRRGELTFSVSSSEAEGISLFDGEKRLQISLYPAAGRTTRYHEDDGRAADVVHRDVSLRFDPDDHAFSVTARLTIRPRALGAALKIRLDDAFRVESVSSPDVGRLLHFRVRGQGSVMVSLGTLSASAGDFDLTLRYAGRLAPTPIRDEVLQLFDVADLRLARTSVYTRNSSWYPELTRDDHATARLRVDLPEDWVALSGGHRTERPVADGRRVAEFEMRRPGRYLALAVGRLEEVGRVRAGGVTLSGYAVSRLQGQVREDLGVSRDILDFYTREFGPAPYDELALVGLESPLPGGHSPPGMVLLAHRPAFLRLARLRDDPAQLPGEPHFFLAHELAHQWWGHGVSGQNYRERWISEAFAHYAAALWVRHARGEVLFQRALEQFDRWAARHTDAGPIHLGYRVGHIEGEPQAFRAVVYDKGAYVLHMLRRLVGPAAFRRALTSLQERFRFDKIGTADVREALEEASGLDLGAFFEAWVFGTALPELDYSWRRLRAEGAHRVEVEVRTRHLPGPVPLELQVETEVGTERRTVVLPATGSVFVLDLPARARDVEVNADRGLLARVERR